jgi:hypothetical protein
MAQGQPPNRHASLIGEPLKRLDLQDFAHFAKALAMTAN